MQKNRSVAEINHSINQLLEQWNISEAHNNKIVTDVIGLQLKKIRMVNKMTQTRVAKAINITFQQVQKYEKGQNLINPIKLLALSQYFNVAYNYWITPILEKELLLITKKRGINNNVYPFKQPNELERETHQSDQ